MIHLARIGRAFFAIGLIAFGLQQLLWGDFVPGRAPAWPATLPGRLVWAYLSGAGLILAGVAILVEKGARMAALSTGAVIFLWALLRHIPVALAEPYYGGAWTNLGKALTLTGGSFAVAGSLPPPNGRWLAAGRVCLGAFLVSSGVQHFLFPQFVATLVPVWISGALFWTYFSAVALIAGGIGLIVPRTARLAAALSGLMIFLWLLMLHVPRGFAASLGQSRNEWTAVVEALAISGIAFVLAGAWLPRRE